MKEIGEKLKEARESIGVSTTEVAEDLKLEKEQIENIENGNVESFKDVFYLKYFIRDYAKYLGLDKDELVDDFNEYIKKEVKLNQEETPKIKSPYTIESKNEKRSKIIVLSIMGILLLVVVYLVYNIVNDDKKDDDDVNIVMRSEN